MFRLEIKDGHHHRENFKKDPMGKYFKIIIIWNLKTIWQQTWLKCSFLWIVFFIFFYLKSKLTDSTGYCLTMEIWIKIFFSKTWNFLHSTINCLPMEIWIKNFSSKTFAWKANSAWIINTASGWPLVED